MNLSHMPVSTNIIDISTHAVAHISISDHALTAVPGLATLANGGMWTAVIVAAWIGASIGLLAAYPMLKRRIAKRRDIRRRIAARSHRAGDGSQAQADYEARVLSMARAELAQAKANDGSKAQWGV